ncbi:MAG: transglutaminase-like domain-containing protein [Clostridia bacterium]|nr:transglutaminase-like domain-containing protein [Clostridia bacterium]
MNINFVSAVLLLLFALPVLAGALSDFSRERMHNKIASLFDSLEFLAAMFISIWLTKKIFFEHDSQPYKQIYDLIPRSIKAALYGHDVLTYLFAVPVALLFAVSIMKLVTVPIYRIVVEPFTDGLYSFIDSFGEAAKRFFGAVWEIPKSLYIVLIVGFLLNFYTYYFPALALSREMNESGLYRMLYSHALAPALNSNIAKRIPVLVNDSFREIGRVIPGSERASVPELSERVKEQLQKRNIKVIEYFNGVTLDEAIKSKAEIDETAKKIVGYEKNDRKKAFLIYKWVSRNIKYDFEKAVSLGKDPRGISSGAIVAFETRKGVCFDYSCLYVAMCRAVDMKVRLVTGLAYSGMSWGDHAWNQVYSRHDNRWIDVDATFGSVADYFDKADFNVDHKYAQVQGEW